jgi:plastocyanin
MLTRIVVGLLAARGAVAAPLDGRVMRDGAGVPYVAVVLEGGDARRAPDEARVDEVQLSFVPKVQVVAPGSRLLFHDRDDEAHGVHGWWGDRTLFNRAVVPGEPGFAVTLDEPGVLGLTCDLHQSMKAFVVVSDSTLAAVSRTDGSFHFDQVPAGSYAMRAYWPDRGHAMGSVARPVRIEGDGAPLSIELPSPAAVAEVAPRPHAETPRPIPPIARALFRGGTSWPHAQWAVSLLVALALMVGFAAAAALSRWGARRGRTIEALFAGCALAFVAGATVVVGLHGAVATALGTGLFTGSFLFGAWRWQARA